MSIIFELLRSRSHEILIGKAVFTAPCGEINPIELYLLKEGHPYKCRKCGKKATHRMLFLSPKYEVEGSFGPAYFCQSCVPDINNVAKNEALYYGILFNK